MMSTATSVSHAPQFKRYESFNFSSHKELPPSHTWDALHDQRSHPVLREPVPVVDLSLPDDVLVDELARVCTSWGAFQIMGHGFPEDLLELVERQCQRLFSSPTEVKRNVLRQGGLRVEPSAKSFWSESFTITSSSSDNEENLRALLLDDYFEFRDALKEYNDKMEKVASRLINLIFATLGSSPEEVGWHSLSEAPNKIAANWYPPCPDPSRAMGLGSHTDTSLLTIIYRARSTGLQILREADERLPLRWVPVPLERGKLAVTMGDLFHILSNGRYRNAPHRVVPTELEGYTLACFYGPHPTSEVAPIEKLCSDEQGPVYRAVTWDALCSLKVQHREKALAMIRKDGNGN